MSGLVFTKWSIKHLRVDNKHLFMNTVKPRLSSQLGLCSTWSWLGVDSKNCLWMPPLVKITVTSVSNYRSKPKRWREDVRQYGLDITAAFCTSLLCKKTYICCVLLVRYVQYIPTHPLLNWFNITVTTTIIILKFWQDFIILKILSSTEYYGSQHMRSQIQTNK